MVRMPAVSVLVALIVYALAPHQCGATRISFDEELLREISGITQDDTTDDHDEAVQHTGHKDSQKPAAHAATATRLGSSYISENLGSSALKLLGDHVPISPNVSTNDPSVCIPVAATIAIAWVCWALYQGFGDKESSFLGLNTMGTKAVFVVYVALFLGASFTTKAIQDVGPDPKVLVLSCFVTKLLMSVVMWRVQDGYFTELLPNAIREWRLILKLGVVALLFAFSDVLRLNFIQNTSPSSFHVLINLRALMLTGVWQFVMGYKLLGRHWFSIACISFGCLVKESPHLFMEGGLKGHYVAYCELCLLMMCTSLGLVYNELLMKRGDQRATPMPVNFQNTCLYSMGLCWMLVEAGVVASRHGVEASPVLQVEQWKRVMNPMVGLCLLDFTLLGIITAYFLKMLSNVAKEVATGFEVLVSLPLDTAVFGTHLGVVEIIGSGMVLWGVDCFARWPIGPEQKVAEPEKGIKKVEEPEERSQKL